MAKKKTIEDLVAELVQIADVGNSSTRDRNRASKLGKLILERYQELYLKLAMEVEFSLKSSDNEASFQEDIEFLTRGIRSLWLYLEKRQPDIISDLKMYDEISKEELNRKYAEKRRREDQKRIKEREERSKVEQGYRELFGLPTEEKNSTEE